MPLVGAALAFTVFALTMNLSLVTGPGSEPVTLAAAKAHLRISDSETGEDALITTLIAVARERAEEALHRALITQTWRLTLDHFPCGWRPGCSIDVGLGFGFYGVYGVSASREEVCAHCRNADLIELPRPALQSVTSVTYIDAAGQQQTLDPTTAYSVDTTSFPGRIVRAWNTRWPVTRTQRNAVTITYVAGYGDDASAIPKPIPAAMLLMIGDLYRNREAQILAATVVDNPTVCALLAPYRHREFY